MEKATNFSPEHLSKLNELLKFAITNPYSDFYRNRLGTQEVEIKDYNAFSGLKITSKDDILDIPLDERIFTPREEVLYYSFSSGTTRTQVGILPHHSNHQQEALRYLFDEDHLKKIGAQRIMFLLPPMSAPYFRNIVLAKKYVSAIPSDITRLPSMATIAKQIGIDGMVALPSVMDAFIISLNKINFDFNRIKWILITSETISDQKMAYLCETFPNASIFSSYGASEFGSIGYQCPDLAKRKDQRLFHPIQESLVVEVVDTEGKTLEMGKSGDLIITKSINKAFPVIRYKIGDRGTLNTFKCECGNAFALKVEGRSNMDIFKFGGVTLQKKAIENSLRSIGDLIEQDYEVHIHEERMVDRFMPRLEFRLKWKEGSKTKRDGISEALLGERISSTLFLSEKNTLHDLVEQGFFLPMKISFVEADRILSNRTVSHL